MLAAACGVVGAGASHQGEVAFMQIAHSGHQSKRADAGALGGSEVFDCFYDLHGGVF